MECVGFTSDLQQKVIRKVMYLLTSGLTKLIPSWCIVGYCHQKQGRNWSFLQYLINFLEWGVVCPFCHFPLCPKVTFCLTFPANLPILNHCIAVPLVLWRIWSKASRVRRNLSGCCSEVSLKLFNFRPFEAISLSLLLSISKWFTFWFQWSKTAFHLIIQSSPVVNTHLRIMIVHQWDPSTTCFISTPTLSLWFGLSLSTKIPVLSAIILTHHLWVQINEPSCALYNPGLHPLPVRPHLRTFSPLPSQPCISKNSASCDSHCSSQGRTLYTAMSSPAVYVYELANHPEFTWINIK